MTEGFAFPSGERTQVDPVSQACTATVDDQGRVTGWSEGATRLLGYAPAEVVGQPAARLLADGVDQSVWRDAAGRGRLSAVVALRHRDGRRIERRLLAHRPASDRPAFDRSASDSSASGRPFGAWQVAAVEPGPAPPDPEELAEWAFCQSPSILGIFDADLRLVRANAGMERALSSTQEEMRGWRLAELVPHWVSDQAEAGMRQALDSGEVQHVGACIGPAGVSAEQGWPTSLAPLRDTGGRVRAVCLTAQQRTPSPLTSGAAEAIDRGHRRSRDHTSTVTLQRSLLPQTLPVQQALDVATRYLPASERLGVGGDWFDVIPLSGTRVAMVVGDVVGHGMRAAATMGRLRTAVRTLADVDLPPDELLTHLDDLVLHLSADEGPASATEGAAGIGTTCLYAVYDPTSRRLTLARAGHPPPAVVAPNGAVRFLDVPPGPPLGLGGLPFETYETELAEGSLIALYTDGLLEIREHDIDEALDRLFSTLARPAGELDTICDRVLTAMLTHRPDDDVALLIARTRALGPDRIASWDLDSVLTAVARARRLATDQLSAWNLDEAAFVTELVVSELVTNAIRYGRPPIDLRLIHTDDTLICEVFDSSSTAPHLRRARLFDEGGRGLLLVGQLAQRWGTRHTTTGKTVWAEQFLSPG